MVLQKEPKEMMTWWKELVGGAFGIIKEPVVEWQKRKTVKLKARMEVEKLLAEAEIEKARAKVEMAKNNQLIEADWDARAQEQAKFSFKDEILMLVLFSPVGILFVSAFMPEGFQIRIIEGVNALDQFPTWYVVLLIGITASVFGLRWLVTPVVKKLNKKI
jgi:uncharacterized membrane protein